jgi:hypothetical protein
MLRLALLLALGGFATSLGLQKIRTFDYWWHLLRPRLRSRAAALCSRLRDLAILASTSPGYTFPGWAPAPGSAPRILMTAVASTPSPLELEDEIVRLKEERNAILLAHYYQESEIQDLADVVGDSLALARAAQNVETSSRSAASTSWRRRPRS